MQVNICELKKSLHNATIHKSKLLKCYLEESIFFSIPTYCKIVSVVGNVIFAIKQKIRKYEVDPKYTHYFSHSHILILYQYG